MARIIPNEQTWLGFTPTVASLAAPTAAEISAAVNLTPYLVSMNAMTRGNTVPTPSFDSLFETTISGTVQATLDADFYRDDLADTAWTTLPRATSGFFLLSRFGGGTGPYATSHGKPITGDKLEIWPILVTSRSMANMSNNAVMTFTVSCSVPQVPNESATVA